MTLLQKTILLSAWMTLVACGGESDSSNTSAEDLLTEETPTEETPIETPTAKGVQTLNVDATSYDDYVYYTLADMQTVSVTDAATDTEWDIAFRRTNIILNGGASGPGDVAGALAVSQDAFYDAAGDALSNVFTNALPDNEGLVALGVAIDTSTLSLQADANDAAIEGNGGWYLYDYTTHQISANTSAFWLIRSAQGNSYAKLNVTDLANAGRALDTVTFTVDVQAAGEESFAGVTQSVTLSAIAAAGAQCYDFDADASSDCTGTAWDIRFDASFGLWLNSGVYGGGRGQGAIAYGQSTADGYAITLSSGAGASVHWIADATSGVFADNSWYAYNLLGRHGIWPNYRVYVVNDGTTYYKVQIAGYYTAEGASGNLTVNVEAL